MKQIKRIYPDGTEKIYRRLSDAVREVGVTSSTIDMAARYGYVSCGCHWQRMEDGKPLPYKLRRTGRTGASHKRSIIIDTLCRLCGDKEAEARQIYKGRRPRNLQAIMNIFAGWYIRQTDIYISSDLWIETINRLKEV